MIIKNMKLVSIDIPHAYRVEYERLLSYVRENKVIILIADDHETFHKILKKQLLKFFEYSDNVEIVEAFDAPSALTLLSQHKPHIATIDMNMPINEFDGMALLERVKLNQLFSETCFMVISSEAREEWKGFIRSNDRIASYLLKSELDSRFYVEMIRLGKKWIHASEEEPFLNDEGLQADFLDELNEDEYRIPVKNLYRKKLSKIRSYGANQPVPKKAEVDEISAYPDLKRSSTVLDALLKSDLLEETHEVKQHIGDALSKLYLDTIQKMNYVQDLLVSTIARESSYQEESIQNREIIQKQILVALLKKPGYLLPETLRQILFNNPNLSIRLKCFFIEELFKIKLVSSTSQRVYQIKSAIDHLLIQLLLPNHAVEDEVKIYVLSQLSTNRRYLDSFESKWGALKVTLRPLLNKSQGLSPELLLAIQSFFEKIKYL